TPARGPAPGRPLFLPRHAIRRRRRCRLQLRRSSPGPALPRHPTPAAGALDSGGTQVSLRTQIHSAFDEVAPTTFGLPERVVQTVLAEGPSRRRRERLM